MQEEQFWLLVSLKLSGEATEEELAELDFLLKKNPERSKQLETLGRCWQQQQEAQPGDLNRHLYRLNAQALPPRRKPWTLVLSIAACTLLVAAGLYLLKARSENRQTNENTVITKPGSKSRVQLPDGSQVWLNADSRITYDESFRGPTREVKLCGEAYFDVAKDKDHPFIIHASRIDVKVLGTSLNVRSYKNEQHSEAVLIRGSIEVSLHGDPDKHIVLKPNEKIMVRNNPLPTAADTAAKANPQSIGAKTIRVPELVVAKAHFQEKDSAVTEILWTKNKLAFDQEPLIDVASKLERWYNIKVEIADDSLRQIEFTGVFEDESLTQVMEALRLTGNFKYTIHKKVVTISH